MSYDSDVVAATSGRGGEADWDKIIKLCDRIRESYGPTAMGAALSAVMRRAKHTDPSIQLQALELLEACVSNCGQDFKAELAKTSFHAQVKDVLNTRTSDPRTIQRLKTLLVTWAQEYKNDGYMSGLVQYVEQLARDGVVLLQAQPSSSSTGYSGGGGGGGGTGQGDDDLERAIRLSLQEAQNTPSSSNAMYPSFSSKDRPPSGGKKVRALYDFEAVEDNELSFKAGEIISVLDDSDENWWKGQTQLGTGLFPANFVSTDLKAIPEPVRGEPKGTTPTSGSVAQTNKVVTVNESQVDLLLDMLKTADITSTNDEENKTLTSLEEDCKVMKKLVDKNISNYQNDIDEMNTVSKQLQDVFALYRKLLQEGPRLSEKAQMAQATPSVAPPTYQSNEPSYYMPPPPESVYNVPPSYGQQPYATPTSHGASYTATVPPANFGAPPIRNQGVPNAPPMQGGPTSLPMQGGPTSLGAPPIHQGGLTSLNAPPVQGGPTSLGTLPSMSATSPYSQPQSYAAYSSGPPPSSGTSPSMGHPLPGQAPPTGHIQYQHPNGTQYNKTPPTATRWDHAHNAPPPQTMPYQPLM